MNRQLLVICILLSMLALRAEPIHVALLGSPAQLVDLLQAELSELKELALLERREIDKIMQERKLAELSWENLSKEFPHTDVLVVLSENNKGKVGRVLAFNAKNGARLMDMNWHDNPYEHVIEMSGEVKSAAAKQTMDGVRYLAWAETRFVNVMDSLKGKCNAWRQLFEQNLLRQETIQLLERERLDIVLSERRLTEQAYALNSSGHLIGLEFEGRGRKDEINCKLICMDVSGEKQFAVEIKDILTALEKTAAEFAVEFEQTLSKLVIDKAAEGKDRKVEAAKYFKMYNAVKSTRTGFFMQKKPWELAAAIALDPENPIYRYQELVDYKLGMDSGSEHWLQRANLLWDKAYKFKNDFPEINVGHLPPGRIADMASAAGQLQKKIAWHQEHGKTETVKELNKNLEALDHFYIKYRPTVMEDFLRQDEMVVFENDMVNPIRFRKKSPDAIHLTDLYFRYGFYVDEKKRMDDYFHGLESWIEPGNATKRIRDVELFPLPWESLTSAASYLEDFLKIAKKVKLVEKLSAYRSSNDWYMEEVRQEAFLLDFVIKAMEARTPEDVKTLFRQFLTNVRKIRPSLFKDDSRDYERLYLTSSPFTAIAQKHGLPEDFAWEWMKNDPTVSKNKKPADIENIIQEVAFSRGSDESMKKLMPYIPQIKQDVMKYFTDKRYYDLLVFMADNIWRAGGMNSGGSRTPLAVIPPANSGMYPTNGARQPSNGGVPPLLTPLKEEFFKAVNEQAKLKYGRYSDLLKTNDNVVLYQACRDGDNLLLLLARIDKGLVQRSPNELFLLSLHPDLTYESILDPILMTDDKGGMRAPNLGSSHMGMHYSCLMACSPSYIVFGYMTNLWVLNRKTKTIISAIQIPLMQNLEIVLTDERLFLLNYTSLTSMNLHGEDRQVIFDEERLDPQSSLDRKGRATCLQLLPNGSLMFLGLNIALQKDKDKPRERGSINIWTCKADGTELKRRLELPIGRHYALYDGGEGLLLSSYNDYHHDRNCIIYRVDMKKAEMYKIVQTPNREFNRYRGPVRTPYSNYLTVDQFIVKNGWLFQGHVYPLCVNISAPEKSPFLWLPVTYKLLSLGDYVMFLRNNCWFMVDTKELRNER